MGIRKPMQELFQTQPAVLRSSVCPYYIAEISISPEYTSMPDPLSTSDAEQGPIWLLGMEVFLSPISYK